MTKKNFFRAPEHNRWFNAALARARRREWYRELLWKRLRAIGPTKSRRHVDTTQYLELLERAARHERRCQRDQDKFLHWILDTGFKPPRPILRLLRGGKDA